MYGGACSGWQEFLQLFRRTASQMHGRLSGGGIDHAHVSPEHTLGYARSKSLCTGFLRREALRIRCSALLPPVRFFLLDLRKNPVTETVAMSLKGAFNTTNIDEIAAYTDDHTF